MRWPYGYPLRPIRMMVDEILKQLSPQFNKIGRYLANTPDGPDSICFPFPIVRNPNWPSRIFSEQFPLGKDGPMVCRHV
jgi:hypothetical protein